MVFLAALSLLGSGLKIFGVNVKTVNLLLFNSSIKESEN